jgi:hypothetical protein
MMLAPLSPLAAFRHRLFADWGKLPELVAGDKSDGFFACGSE